VAVCRTFQPSRQAADRSAARVEMCVDKELGVIFFCEVMCNELNSVYDA
jgi:hypothetical protein